MKVLVAYSSKTGGTRGIAAHIGETLQRRGLQVDVLEAGSVNSVSSYDAFVVGSAVYMFHWMKEAKQFLSRNKKVFAGKPVWLFSSGPVGTDKTNAKGQDLLDVSVSGPKELDELREITNFRDHKIFFGVLDGSKLTGVTGMMYRMARRSEEARKSMPEGDFRDWDQIGTWADGIADALPSVQRPSLG
jgi:menaquinone-dependent protoporphyrinogen oxidase